MAKRKEFPQTLFFRWDAPSDAEGPYPMCDQTQGDLVEGDGPTEIAEYALVSRAVVRKGLIVNTTKARKRKAKR
jgi:hypothetical protein